MWPPLRRPNGEYTIAVAPPANTIPVTSRRTSSFGIHPGTADPEAKSITTAESLISNSRAVPTNSARYSRDPITAGSLPARGLHRPLDRSGLPDRARGLRLRDGPRRVDEPDVAEGLREVPQQLTGLFVDLLGQEPDVVGKRDGAFEHGPGPVDLAGPGQRLGEPERAQQEGSLGTPQAV